MPHTPINAMAVGHIDAPGNSKKEAAIETIYKILPVNM
jgi:hypothetical protein